MWFKVLFCFLRGGCEWFNSWVLLEPDDIPIAFIFLIKEFLHTLKNIKYSSIVVPYIDLFEVKMDP